MIQQNIIRSLKEHECIKVASSVSVISDIYTLSDLQYLNIYFLFFYDDDDSKTFVHNKLCLVYEVYFDYPSHSLALKFTHFYFLIPGWIL